MGKVAFIFPGQGSQVVGMGKSLVEKETSIKSLFSTADEVLKYPLSKLIFEGPQEALTLTTNAQPALLLTSIAILKYVQRAGVEFDYVAGHSLGEYSALVAANAISLEEGIYAVHRRGELMEEAVPNREGGMAAVLGMEREELQKVTEMVCNEGYCVQLANINCPNQIVISGTMQGIHRASILAKEAGAKRVLPLEVSGPFHSDLMKPAADKFRVILDEMTLSKATVPVISNVTAKEMQEPTEIKNCLIEQLYSPVAWEDSVRRMISLGVDIFVEIGPGKVLSGLVRKIDPTVKTYSVCDESSAQLMIDALKEGSA